MSELPQNDLNAEPTVIGIYGIPGSGKTTLVDNLGQFLDPSKFLMFEGSTVINSIVTGGISAFKQMNEESKFSARCESIKFIKAECLKQRKAGIVTGHLIFWHEGEINDAIPVHTPSDLDVYTHIIYLHTDARTVFQRRKDDQRKERQQISVECIQRWQNAEISMLRKLCRENAILFKSVKTAEPLTEVVILVKDFVNHNETVNLARAKASLDEAITASGQSPETVLVFDADKTLAPVDASEMFWEETPAETSPVSEALSSPSPYTYLAFRQVMLLYEEAVGEEEFEQICRVTAENVRIHPEFVRLIRRACRETHIKVIVFTCGNPYLWKLILLNHGLNIHVIGGCRLNHGYVLSKNVKTTLVEHLRSEKIYVACFGDSPIDLGMLKAASLAIVVVAPSHIRSTTMTLKLKEAIENGLEARQLLLPDSDQILDVFLPVIELNEETIRQIFRRRVVRVVTADEIPAKLLMTPTRDADISGPGLREAHRRIGWYLTIHVLSKYIGVESYDIPHVQGKVTDGYRLAQESKTTIIALMRGGEPMAFGISDALPKAMFLHSKNISDVPDDHIKDQSTVIIADSVINTGKSIVEYVHGVRKINKAANIIICAGVIQQDIIDIGSERAFLSKELGHLDGVSIFSLRISANKFTGSGVTDTGNRLFNTPHIL